MGPVGYKGLWEDDFEVKLERDRQNTLSAATEILQSAGLRSSTERKAEEGHSQSAIDHRDLHVVENPRYAGAGMIPNSELRKKAVAAALRRWGDANPEAPLSKLSPDPIIIDHKSIGLTPDFCSTVLWTNNGEEIVYSNGCSIIALRVKVAAVCWLALPHCFLCPPTVFFSSVSVARIMRTRTHQATSATSLGILPRFPAWHFPATIEFWRQANMASYHASACGVFNPEFVLRH